MNRRSFLQTCSAATANSTSIAAGRQPNILFIMTDQQRWDTLGANGNRLIRTPNLDRLAAESANFERAFVQAPVCVPSRVTFFTGRYPHSHQNRVNYTPLKAGETLMQQYLQDAGYQTGTVGKLHYIPPTAEHARTTGFDRVLLHDGVPYLTEYSDYSRWRKENDPRAHIPYRQTVKPAPPGQNPFRMLIAREHTETAWVGLKTREFLTEMAADSRPFFLFSSFFQPHSPFLAPEPFDSMYDDVEIPLPRQVRLEEIQELPRPLQRLILRGQPAFDMDRERLQWAYRTYYASVSQIDQEVGRILQTLDDTGQSGNTLVVFASDHGDQMLEHGLMGKNCFFEASVRVPLMIRYPGVVRPGGYRQLVESTDLLPTLFNLCGVREPVPCQGRSLASLLRGESYEEREAVFAENIIPEVITTGRLDFHFEKGQGIKDIRHPDAKMVRTGRWKLNYYASGEGELYDLAEDPSEEVNLFDDPGRAGVKNELKDRILHWLMTADETDQIAPRWHVGAPPG